MDGKQGRGWERRRGDMYLVGGDSGASVGSPDISLSVEARKCIMYYLGSGPWSHKRGEVEVDGKQRRGWGRRRGYMYLVGGDSGASVGSPDRSLSVEARKCILYYLGSGPWSHKKGEIREKIKKARTVEEATQSIVLYKVFRLVSLDSWYRVVRDTKNTRMALRYCRS